MRMALISDGVYFENPHALKNAITKLKPQQRVVSRRKKGSVNRRNAVQQLARTHTHMANIRKDGLHKATTIVTRTKSAIVIEDLNESRMMKNHHLVLAIADVGMYEFRRQLIYKGAWYGCQVWIADRYYPSTKRCSQCGHVKERIRSGECVYHCEYCGLVIDRDLNAAINLEQLLIRPGSPAMLNETGTKYRICLMQK
jgi:putative transposase